MVLKIVDCLGDTHPVRRLPLLLILAVLASACSGSSDEAVTATTDPEPAATQPTVADPVTTTTEGNIQSEATDPPDTVAETPTESTEPETIETETTAAVLTEPSYEVFLAAVAESVIGTRFEDAAFEEPEIFAATGLLMCERLAAGFEPDEVALEYLTELTGGDPADADDDQLVLAGALLGASEVALCPQAG